MARRASPPQQPQRPLLSVDEKRRAVTRLEKRISELESFDPQTVQKRFSDPQVTALQAAIDEALSAVFGHKTVEYKRYERATKLDHGPLIMRADPMFSGGAAAMTRTRHASTFPREERKPSPSCAKLSAASKKK
jgi:hypothetical protein